MALAIIAISLLAVVAIAQEGAKPRVRDLVLVGRGFAVSSSDPSDFKLLRVGVARVTVTVDDVETTLLRGVLNADGDHLRVKDITHDNSSVSGNLYRNDTQVGSISLQSVVKGEHTIWYGTMTLDGASYNVYLFSIHRSHKPDEVRDKVSDYCRANRGDPNCRERMEDFCQSNPEDSRCKQILRTQCLNQTNDERCRFEFKEVCKQSPDSEECARFQLKGSNKYCDRNPEDRRCVEIRTKAERRGVKTEGE